MIKKLLALGGALVALVAVFATLLNWPLPQMPRVGIKADVLIRNVTVVDVGNGRLLPGRDVRIRAGRIDAIDAAGPMSEQDDRVVVDGSGRFLMPGLWDMHVHSLKLSPQYTHALTIAAGVTGVREMWGCPALPDSFVACGDDIERWRKDLLDHTRLAPRYVQRSSFAINGEGGVPSAAPEYFKARSAEDARALVAHHAETGVDVLKTYTDLSPSLYQALASDAATHGLLLAGHLPVRVPLEQALAAGQRSIEHPRLFLFECYRGAAEFRALPNPVATYSRSPDLQARLVDERDPARCAELMTAMATSRTWWTPTLQVLRMSANAGNAEFRNDPRLRYVPRIIRAALWDPDANRWAEMTTNDSGRNLQAELYRLALDNVREAHAAGVGILAGTDAGDTYVFPGFAIHDELAELVRAGLSPAEALRTATLDAARFTGMDEDYGSIEVGKVADMILLEADPLAHIGSTERIAGVFFNGQHLNRADLDELLAFSEAQADSVLLNLQLLWGALRSPVVRAQFAD